MNDEIEDWKKTFHNLEKEKETIYQEMKEVQRERIVAREELKMMKDANENMGKYIRKVEQNADMHLRRSIKDISGLSKRQVHRRLQELGTRAQKALWFGQTFGLVLEALQSKQFSSFPSPHESQQLLTVKFIQPPLKPFSPILIQPSPQPKRLI